MVSAGCPRPDGPESRLQSLGIQSPAPPTPFGTYVETVQAGSLLFLTGMLPVVDHQPKYLGRLGRELDVEAGRDAARIAVLSGLASARQYLGSLDEISAVIRLGVFIATFGDFFDQPKVADGASDLLRDIFGSQNLPARLVIGVSSLPLGMPIELEFILKVSEPQGA